MYYRHLTGLRAVAGVVLIGSLGAGPALGATVSVTVPGRASPHLAGLPTGSICCLGDAGLAQSPVEVVGLPLAPGTVLTFGVTGSVSSLPGTPPADPPDGGAFFVGPDGQPGTPSRNGIAGLIAPTNALVGVFLDESRPPPSATPPRLDFGGAGLGTSFASLCPGLRQAFFIGDGLSGDGTGTIQGFVVPAGATRLFLGTVDGPGGVASSGALSVDVTSGPAEPGGPLVSAVLPSSRSVQVGATATAFGTIINTGTSAAVNCGVAPGTTLAGAFAYQTTNSVTNALIGVENTPATCIAPGASQSFVVAFTPVEPFDPTDVPLIFECDNAPAAPTVSGLNTLLLTASSRAVPDVIALSATFNNDGIVNIPGAMGTGALAVATSNLGAPGDITASADTGTAALPISLSVCQTDPGTGACLAAPATTVTTPIASGATPTFAVFATGSGNVPFDPAVNRIFFRLRDASSIVRGSTSVAVRTEPDGTFLTRANVDAAALGAAASVNVGTLVVAVVDRMGNPLAIFRQPNAPATTVGNFGATVDTNELALSLARTGAFFSNDQAPLSSRTVRFISGVHFPPGIRNKPNAALYGIENTNRGCSLNATFNPGQTIVPARGLDGLPCNAFDRSGCGLGIATGKADITDSNAGAVNPGGIPIFKDTVLVGGIGVAGAAPDVVEFAALVGSISGGPGFGPAPAPPGFITLDGLQLPFVAQTTQPGGTSPGPPVGNFSLGPIASQLGAAGVPTGWLVGPLDGSNLNAGEVTQIVNQAVAQAQRTRAAIRLPLNSPTQMVIAVGDVDGTLLALFRMNDATIFSIDVAAAKARNVAYFSSPGRPASDLPGVPPGIAVTNRTISFGAQPFYPPGIDSSGPGPFFGLYASDTATACTQGSQPPNANQNGIVFFPGSTALFKNGQMVGGLGVSGDGVEQDDLVTAAGATGFAPPPGIRADQIEVGGVRLPYLKFPRNPEL